MATKHLRWVVISIYYGCANNGYFNACLLIFEMTNLAMDEGDLQRHAFSDDCPPQHKLTKQSFT